MKLAAEDSDRPPDRRQTLSGLIARDPDALLLAVDGETIIGCVVGGWDGWRAHLYRLAVRPEHRWRGIARWLLAVAEQRLRGPGAIRIDAMVLNSNQSAHAAWSAHGYRPQENWSRRLELELIRRDTGCLEERSPKSTRTRAP